MGWFRSKKRRKKHKQKDATPSLDRLRVIDEEVVQGLRCPKCFAKTDVFVNIQVALEDKVHDVKWCKKCTNRHLVKMS